MTERVFRLVDLIIETKLGKTYTFPDVEDTIVAQVLRNVERHPNITIVNQSNACLVLPTRIVQVLKVDGAEKWRAPA